MTQFKHACFISYRNSRETGGIYNHLASEVAKGLMLNLDGLDDDIVERRGNSVFWDKNSIEHGDMIPFVLGQGINKSLCWLVVYTQNYLQAEWCASEFHKILELEEYRLNRLGISGTGKTFIIPLLFKTKATDLPPCLENHICVDFGKFTLRDRKIWRADGWAETLDELADAIYKRGVFIKQSQYYPVNLCEDDNCSITDIKQPDGLAAIKEFVSELTNNIIPRPQMPIS